MTPVLVHAAESCSILTATSTPRTGAMGRRSEPDARWSGFPAEVGGGSLIGKDYERSFDNSVPEQPQRTKEVS